MAQITFSTSEHTPQNEQEALCYQTITNIRVVMLNFFPEVRISNSSFQYYGVREWIVRGSCMCNGHASTCVPGPGEAVVGGVDRVSVIALGKSIYWDASLGKASVLSVCRSVHSVSSSISPLVCQSVCLNACTFCQSINLSVCLSASLSVSLCLHASR